MRLPPPLPFVSCFLVRCPSSLRSLLPDARGAGALPSRQGIIPSHHHPLFPIPFSATTRPSAVALAAVSSVVCMCRRNSIGCFPTPRHSHLNPCLHARIRPPLPLPSPSSFLFALETPVGVRASGCMYVCVSVCVRDGVVGQRRSHCTGSEESTPDKVNAKGSTMRLGSIFGRWGHPPRHLSLVPFFPGPFCAKQACAHLLAGSWTRQSTPSRG